MCNLKMQFKKVSTRYTIGFLAVPYILTYICDGTAQFCLFLCRIITFQLLVRTMNFHMAAWAHCKYLYEGNCGILLPKLFWPTVIKMCSSDRKCFLKFEAEGREFAKSLRSLEQFIQTRTIFDNKIFFNFSNVQI